MPILRTGESDYDKELAKWDLPKRLGGHNADGYEEFPRMLYKAFRDETGKARCGDNRDLYSTDPVVQARAIAFTAQCQLIVRSEDAKRLALSQGWRLTQQEALDTLEAYQQDIAKAAAEAAYAVQRMSAKAHAEYDAHDAASEALAVDVPAPKKKPGRPRKTQAAA
jgi:hypothetical protein